MSSSSSADQELALEQADIPENMKDLRACLRCALIKNFKQFYEHGCENCPYLELQERNDRIFEVIGSVCTARRALEYDIVTNTAAPAHRLAVHVAVLRGNDFDVGPREELGG